MNRLGFVFCSLIFFANSSFSENFIEKKDELKKIEQISADQEMIFRRGGKNRKRFAIIMSSIANLAKFISGLVTGSKSDQKENIGGIINTGLEAAAQLSALNAAYANRSADTKVDPEFWAGSIVEALYQMIIFGKDRVFALDSFPLLKELSAILTYSERTSWFLKKILGNDLMQKLLKEALNYARNYLHKKVDGFVDYIQDLFVEGKDFKILPEFLETNYLG